MDHAQHTAIVNLIWGVMDDVLRDFYLCRKYRDVILPIRSLEEIRAKIEALEVETE
jgi:type I restriction enzyme M protein